MLSRLILNDIEAQKYNPDLIAMYALMGFALFGFRTWARETLESGLIDSQERRLHDK